MKTLTICFFILGSAYGEILYETDFDEFPVGPNQWTSASEWSSNDDQSGAQSIDAEVISGLLNTASLGFTEPGDTFTSVILDLSFDPAVAGSSVIEIDSILGIEDSTNDRRDDFFLTFYNREGNRLASIRFDNESPDTTDSQFGIWRETSSTQFDTGIGFLPGELFNFFATIDLEGNTWSADVDGLPLFENVLFTDRSGPLDLGFLAFEWDLTAATPTGHGDNFLVVTDLFIRRPETAPPPVITIGVAPGGAATLSWRSAPGWVDQVQFSEDLVTWDDSLPDSRFFPGESSRDVSYRDPTEPGLVRFYRVQRQAE